MPVSTAQCCPSSQSQPAAECSYTVDTPQDRIPGSRLPWPPLHSLFPFLPSSLCCLALPNTFAWRSVFRCTTGPSAALYTCICECISVSVCLSVLWATLSFTGRDRDPVFRSALLPDSICSVHFSPQAPIASYQGASSNTRPTNGLLMRLSGLSLTPQRPSVSPQSH